MLEFMIEALGWSADLLFLGAYFLVSRGKLKGEGRVFNLMNLVASVLYGVYAVIRHLHPVLILEIFWAGIGIHALYKSFPKPWNLKLRLSKRAIVVMVCGLVFGGFFGTWAVNDFGWPGILVGLFITVGFMAAFGLH